MFLEISKTEVHEKIVNHSHATSEETGMDPNKTYMKNQNIKETLPSTFL